MAVLEKFAKYLNDELRSSKQNQVEDLTEQAADEFIKVVRRSINMGSPPYGSWKPLSEKTLKIRRKDGIYSSDPLYHHGNMEKEIDKQQVGTSFLVGWFGVYPALKAKYSTLGTEGGIGNVKTGSIKVTRSSQRYMMAEYGVLLNNKVNIPPRPLVRPCAKYIFEEYGEFIKISIKSNPNFFGIVIRPREPRSVL